MVWTDGKLGFDAHCETRHKIKKKKCVSFKVRRDINWMKVVEELHEIMLMTNSSNIGNSISWPHPLASMEISSR